MNKNTETNNKTLDLILVLNGGFIPLKIQSKDVEIFEKDLHNHLKSERDVYAQILGATFRVKSLIGWYFREQLPSPVAEVIKFMEKKLPDANEGEDWKNNE